MPRGRRIPYTERGILRCKCWRCGEPAQHQWNVCADGNVQRPICTRCDIALNTLVLRWAGDPEWRSKTAAYRRKLMSRYPSKKRDPKKVAKKAATKKKAAAKPAKAKKAAPKMVKVRKTRSVGKSELPPEIASVLDAHLPIDTLAAPPKPASRWYRFRCAITGLFTGRTHAKANPDTTVRERGG